MRDFIVKMVHFTFPIIIKICSRKWGRIEYAQCALGRVSYKNTITKNALIVKILLHATVFDLKQAVEQALKNTYCIMDKLMVTE